MRSSGRGASVRVQSIGRSVGRQLYTYPGFSRWCPCLPKRECERKHHDERAKGDADVRGECGAEISRTGEFQETRGRENVCERGGGYAAGYLERYAEIARNERYCREGR